MKNLFYIIISFLFLHIGFIHGQTRAELIKPLKNAISISGGTSFSKDWLFNPSCDLRYSRLLWRNFGFNIGLKYQNHTFDKVEYSTGEYKYNLTKNKMLFVGIIGDFDISERWGMCTSVLIGRSLLDYDYYFFHSKNYRRFLVFSYMLKYSINTLLDVYCEYSYNIHGLDIYWSVNASSAEEENRAFREMKPGNDFNNHDLKLGISVKF